MTRSRNPGPSDMAKAIGALALVAVGVLLFFAPLPSLELPSLDLPSLPVPDLPGWLSLALKWGKLAIPAVLVLLVALSQVDVRRGAGPQDEQKS